MTPSIWLQELNEFRRKKDAFFATAPESPLTQQAKRTFKGLKYFPPDQSYRLETKLSRYADPELVRMATSTGTLQRFQKIGHFEFQISGQPVRLQAYKSAERESSELFIPFRDRTSGSESYGASRYLDLEITPDDRYVIDFNYAYNPYCAYSKDYICPLAPNDNWLRVSINAGEMNYQE